MRLLFTGIIHEAAELEAVERTDGGALLRIRAELASGLAPGASVSVSGACLTVTDHDEGAFAADVMNQTLALTTLGELEPGARVNLEPALRAGDPLGGHLVSGHVDAAGSVAAIVPDGIARRLRVDIPEGLHRYVVEHGSIALDGVSLTVARLTDSGFEVSLIPETLERTTLGGLEAGARVNVEVDQIARYVERLLPSFEREGTDG